MTRTQVRNLYPIARGGLLFGLLVLASVQLLAQNYSVGNLRGTYAFGLLPLGGVLPVAGVGVVELDGAGNVTGGRSRWNVPDGSYDKRRVDDFTITGGSYQVNENGQGTLIIEGLPVTSWQLVIQDMEPSTTSGTRRASELRLVSDSIDPFGGNLLTGECFLRPDDAIFSPAQFDGKYVRRFSGFAGFSEFAAFGAVNIDGQGNVQSLGDTVVNLPSESLGGRSVINIPAAATITQSPDGLGTLTVLEGLEGLDGGNSVTLRSKRDNEGNLVGLEALLILYDLSDLGSLITVRAILQFEPN